VVEEVLDPKEARDRILKRRRLGAMVVDGKLDLSGQREVKSLPRGLCCFELDASETSIKTVPDDISVECRLSLQNCRKLKSLPKDLTVGSLDLRGCSALESLPERLDVWFLDVSGCHQLESLPQRACIQNGGLSVSGCMRLKSLPDYLRKLSTLDLSDCSQIVELPPALRIGLWIDIGGSGITDPTANMAGVGLRWRGVSVDERIAFRPQTITAEDALKERNAERRRVMIERMGLDRFFAEAKAKTLDKDTDAGGERRLLRVPLANDEDIVCLSLRCPSTGRHYMMRVPPDMKGCHQAAAWMAGFTDPRKYKPVIET